LKQLPSLLDLVIVGSSTLQHRSLKESIMYQLEVAEMSCGHCVGSVTKAVQGVDASARVEVDLAQRKVSVQSTAPLEQVTAAIEAAGYPVISKAVA
jgi:copper chaperone